MVLCLTRDAGAEVWKEWKSFCHAFLQHLVLPLCCAVSRCYFAPSNNYLIFSKFGISTRKGSTLNNVFLSTAPPAQTVCSSHARFPKGFTQFLITCHTPPEQRLRTALNKTDITYHHYVARSILNSAKQAKDNDDDVEEVG